MGVASRKAHLLLCFSIGFCFAMLLNLCGQKVTTPEPAVTMALQSVQPAKTQLLHSTRPLPPLNPKELEMAIKKSGISMQEYEANKRRCEQDAVRYGKGNGQRGCYWSDD